jgi:hypothetical protein
MSTRGDLLREAIDIIDGDRNVQYGEPTADFQRTADLLNAIEFSVSGKPLQPHHVAIIGIALKLSRMTWSPGKYDHWLDVAGYAGCGWECAMPPEEPKGTVTYQRVLLEDGWKSHKFIDGKFVCTEDYYPAGVRVS